ncbi:MAG TPA: homocysteine S-methyltransferase family protein [Spirochaetia bacterium]|nr:homocysteine S-methyltransferase family protein [Spirochaetia bacterium]
MNTFSTTLQDEGVLLLDGAWGTEFFRRGLMPGCPPDEWNLTHPEIVQEITREYLSAGARVILTNTFGANRYRLEPHGLSDRAAEINRKAAGIAREAIGHDALLAGDIGPTARFLALGEVSAEELGRVFGEQARSLAEGGVDLIVVESMTDADEMAIAVEAAVQETGLPVVASMTYNRTPHGYRTMMGNPPDVCVKKAEHAGAAVIGANCGSGIEDYVPLAPVLRSLTSLPLWVKANAGIPQIVGGKVTYPLSPEQYASFVPAILKDGVSLIGGCCGTSPSFIREIGKVIAAVRGS